MKQKYFILYQRTHKNPTRYDTVMEVEDSKKRALGRFNVLVRNRFKPVLINGTALSGDFRDFKTIQMYEDGIDRHGNTAEQINDYFNL